MEVTFKRGSATLFNVLARSAEVTDSVMEVGTLSLKFTARTPVRLMSGDSVRMLGEDYFLSGEPRVEVDDRGAYKYECKFKDPTGELEDTLCFFLDEDAAQTRVYCSSSDFSLSATAGETLDLICRNLNRNGGGWGWRVDASVDCQKVYDMEFKDTDCLDALKRLCEKAECEWERVGRSITLVKSVRNPNGAVLEYPESLLSPLTVEGDGGEWTCDRLFVFGGQRNIPDGYGGGTAQRLKMRGGNDYLQRNFTGRPVEKVKTFDDIYPRLNSHASAVRTKGSGDDVIVFFSDPNIGFDVDSHLLAGTSAKVSFTDGLCVGYEFEVARFDPVAREFEIMRSNESGYVIPNETMKPKPGDSYVLLDVRLPDQYVERAEDELLEEATKFFAENCGGGVKASVKLSRTWAEKARAAFAAGQVVRLRDAPLGIDEDIRIDKAVYAHEGGDAGWTTELTLSDFKRKTRLNTISNGVTDTAARAKRLADALAKDSANQFKRNERTDTLLDWKQGWQ